MAVTTDTISSNITEGSQLHQKKPAVGRVMQANTGNSDAY